MGMKTPQVVLDRIREDFTRALAVVDELHVAGHLGAVFTLSRKVTIPAESVVWMVGQTNGNSVHYTASVYDADEGGVEVQLREGVVFSDGTALTPACRNRQRKNTSTFSVWEGPSVSDSGTRLSLVGLPTAARPIARAPQGGGDSLEWQLADDETYGLRVENLTDGERTMYVYLTWYEPELMDDG